ncbi:MAG TPA: hypothetical protein VFW98_18295 [Gemmatimonadaceae bacterium]|nr:hypothetical protein [Gemmatimonadaceae bacterium]
MPAADSADAHPDSTRAARDSAEHKHALRHAHKRIPLTSALLATAYRDPAARTLIARARAARFATASSLLSYDATARERISAWFRVHHLGLRRLVYRSETATRVRWRRGTGVWVDVLGARTAIPMAFHGVRVLDDALDESPIPYFPGREGLLNLAGMHTVTKGDDDALFMHPLDEGAEAYYRYASGDSVELSLPDGHQIRLREVTVTARRPRWDLLVGSLWFDVASGQLVRAVFRPSMPFDVLHFLKEQQPDDYHDIPRMARAALSPLAFTITAFTVEYGLRGERWWLPRLQTVQGEAQAGVLRMPFSVEQTFGYASVNGTDSLPPIVIAARDSAHHIRSDSLVGPIRVRADSAAATMLARRDSTDRSRGDAHHRHGADNDPDLKALDCPVGDTLIRTRSRYDGQLRVAYRVPCDTAALAHSAELPPSIFDGGETIFDTGERDALVHSLSMTLQPGWGPLPLELHYGIDRGMLRYNRVEGLSAGIDAEEQFGKGLAAEATLRIGSADLQPNAQVELRRSNARTTYQLGIYRRLNPASDWGDPFSVGSSLDALLFGRDEGFYYRGWGAELSGAHDAGLAAHLTWRLFAERESSAGVETQFSLPNALNGVEFLQNIAAARATESGLAGTFTRSFGTNPFGWRTTATVRGEAATGTFDYTRGSLEATLSHPIGSHLAGAITGSAGASGGTVPPQRLWYLGGTQTLRGLDPGSVLGDAYWLTRMELGGSSVKIRPVLFADLGWAGDRHSWRAPGRPASDVGVGASVMDGLIRFDVARSIHPDQGWRVQLYMGTAF